MIQYRGDCWDDPWGDGTPLYPYPEEDPIGSGGVPATPKPPDRPGGHYEQLPNGGWMWVADPPSGWQPSDVVGKDENGNPTYPYASPQVGETYGGGGGGGSRGGGGSLPSFSFNPGPAPMFDAPTFNRRPDFVAPSWEQLKDDPGYKFRSEQGLGALAHRYASAGNLITGGAKKGFIDYNQALASQEYDNAYNRALGTYKTNFEGDLSAYDRLFQEKESEFKPKFAEWQTLAQLGQRGAELNFNRDWDLYSFNSDDEFRREESNRRLLESILSGGLG